MQGTITGSLFSGNRAVGTGNAGATANGGAIAFETSGFFGGSPLTVSGSTLVGNEAIGGSGSTTAYGGPAIGGAIETYGGVLDLNSDAFSFNEALGGSSPLGVSFATGGAVNSIGASSLGTSTISNSLFFANQAIAGTGGGTLTTHRRRRDGNRWQPLRGEQHQLPRQPGRRQPGGQRRRGYRRRRRRDLGPNATMSIQGGRSPATAPSAAEAATPRAQPAATAAMASAAASPTSLGARSRSTAPPSPEIPPSAAPAARAPFAGPAATAWEGDQRR